MNEFPTLPPVSEVQNTRIRELKKALYQQVIETFENLLEENQDNAEKTQLIEKVKNILGRQFVRLWREILKILVYDIIESISPTEIALLESDLKQEANNQIRSIINALEAVPSQYKNVIVSRMYVTLSQKMTKIALKRYVNRNDETDEPDGSTAIIATTKEALNGTYDN